MEVKRVGIDLAKNVFQLHGVDRHEQAVFKRRLKRDQWLRVLLDNTDPTIAEDDLVGLVRVFSDDTVVLSDGGGIVSAAIRPVTGPQRIAQLLMHLSRNAAKDSPILESFFIIVVTSRCICLVFVCMSCFL